MIKNDCFVSLTDRLKDLNMSCAPSLKALEDNKQNEISCSRECDRPNFADSNSSTEQAVVEVLLSHLLEYGSMHYLSLIKCIGKRKKDYVHRYFKNLSIPEKLTFFQSHANIFIIENDGYVTLSVSALEGRKRVKPKEKEVVEYFTSALRTIDGVPLDVFVKYIQCSTSTVKNYFESITLSSIVQFLKKHHYRFVIDRYSFIYLRTEIAGYSPKSLSARVQFHNLRISNSSDKCVEFRALKVLCSTLSQYGSMHYLALEKCSAGKANNSYFRKSDPMSKFMFFENYSNTFTMKNNGYVAFCTSSDDKLREAQLVNYFTSVLRTKQRMSCLELAKGLQYSNLDAKYYFGLISSSELLKFFEDHDSRFILQNGYTVSLRMEAGKGAGMGRTTDCEIIHTLERTFPNTIYVEDSHALNKSGYMFEEVCRKMEKTLQNAFTVEDGSKAFLADTVAERILEEERKKKVLKFFATTLKEYPRLHYLELEKRLQASKCNVNNYFNSGSSSHFFFKYHPSIFVIDNNSYVSLTEKAPTDGNDKYSIIQEDELKLSTDGNDSYRFLQEYELESPIDENDKYSLIQEDELELQDGYFVSLREEAEKGSGMGKSTDCEIIHTLESDFPNTIYVEDSNALKKTRHMFEETCHKVEKPLQNAFAVEDSDTMVERFLFLEEERKKKVLKFFVTTLKEDPQLHYLELEKRLQASKSDVNNYFSSGSSSYFFFKYHPSIFVIDSYSYVSLSKNAYADGNDKCSSIEEDELELPLTKKSCCNQSSNPKKGFDDNAVQPDITIRPISNHIVETVDDRFRASDMNSPFHKIKCTPDYEGEYFFREISGLVESNQVEGSTLSHSMTESHMQSIRYFVMLLEESRSVHYHKLLYEACIYDRYTSDFFSYFTMADLLEFIRMHPMYFSVQDDGNVKLIDSTITPSNVFVSEDHVCRVTSSMEDKSVRFFMNVLQHRKHMSLRELECYLGFAPGYVLSYFVANYYGEDFSKFYEQRPTRFRIRSNGYVELCSETSLEIDCCS